MKKILALLTALAMSTALLAGCGEEDTEKTYSDKKNSKNEESYSETLIPSGKSIDAEIGEYITFGKYEQDNKTSNGKEDIEWLVLDVEGDKALVISRYGLDAKPYNEDYVDITWEDCTLRNWLNDDFYNAAFSKEEQAQISTTTVKAEDNPKYGTDAGNDTKDKVFLLSISEAEEYFSSDSDRECEATAYAEAQGASVSISSCNCWWWLRSPGNLQGSAAFVSSDGVVDPSGYSVHSSPDAVRPALWISLNS